MPRPILTPEERKARKRADQASYREQNRAKLAAAENARRLEKRATLTPEEHTMLNRRRNAGQRRRYHANLDKSRAKGRAHQKARRAALPPKAPRAKQDPQIAKERRLEWNKAHPRTIREANKKWRAAHPERVKAANDRRPKPLPRNPAYEQLYYVQHIETISARVRAWAKANPARVRVHRMRRRARFAAAPINDVTPEQRQLVIDAAHGRCVYCPHYHSGCRRCRKGTHTALTVDHISPVGPEGPNTLSNLVACCRSCNSKKKRKPNPVPVQPLLL
jgi:hypothetical protein